jgi:multiple RNA-binding domain-containing protein 1
MATEGTSRLFVQDLPPHCDETALRKHFSAYGVTDVQIPRRKADKKKSRGFAFVGLKDADSARRAAKALNGAYWRTSKLRVAPAAKRKAPEVSKPPPKKKAKKTVPPPKERLAPTKRERFLELAGVKQEAPVAEEAPVERSEEAYDESMDDLAYLRSKQDAVAAEESDGDDDDGNARVFLSNIPYGAGEEKVERLCEKYGAVSEVHLPIDSKSRKRKGFGFVTYVLPSDADACVEGLHGSAFEGRVLTAKRAEMRPADHVPIRRTFADKRADERKKAAPNDQSREFVSATSAKDAAAERSGASKAQLFDPTRSDAAVASTLAESAAQNEARTFFARKGYALDASTRSRTALLVKNLPASTSVQDVRTLFAQSGVVNDVLLAPSHTSAIVEFEQPSEARTALKKLAYRAFDGTPLYVGWAPSRNEDSDDEVETSTIYVKNLSFATTTQDLERHFATAGNVRSVVFPGDKDAGFANRGYGFVEFSRATDAAKALSLTSLDGRTLVIESSRVARKVSTAKSKQSKLIVRNLAFAASQSDVRDLFGTFGPLRNVRVPKRYDGRARGFAFVEFERAQDAASARRALGAAHLYGRHLVIDWAGNEGVS